MEKFNIKRDGVEIASDVEESQWPAKYTDTGLEPETEYTYTVEISGVDDSEASVNTKTLELSKTTLVSNKVLTWDDLPAWNQENNGSLKLLSTEVKDNVPVIVETGEMVERHNFKTREVEQVPETVVQYETRATFTYEADFEWDNRFDSLNEDNLWDDKIIWDEQKILNWLVDVLQFKNNQLRSGLGAFERTPAAQLTALPDLDTSNLTSMVLMFDYAPNFNQPLDNFDTSNVTSMIAMFQHAYAFNGSLDFNTSNVTNRSDMSWMFNRAAAFHQDISNWCVEKIAVKPDNFDTNSGIADQPLKQPKWREPC